jgi:hypothetical protein
MGKHPWWAVRWWRVVLALVILFGSIALLEQWIGPFLVARSMATYEAAVLPTPQPDSTVATEPTSRLKRGGVSFEVPWSETDQSKSVSNSGMGLLLFTNRLAIIVDRPSRNLEFIRAMKGIRAGALRHELGDEVLNSEFALTSAALGTRGNDAKWWRPPIYNEKVALLLVEKSEITGFALRSQQLPIPIYSLSFGGIRGFQVGDLRGRQNEVKLVLFDKADRECRIALLNFQNVTQAEINALIATLRFEE